jgi:[NiFe] hydrogenase diaphorase moiety small subunit
MSVTFKIDGVEVSANPDLSILQAATRAGIYIPTLCAHPDLVAHGNCRVCTVLVKGRPVAACMQPVTQGWEIDNSSPGLAAMRRSLIEMLFIEGNHYCPTCEKSGNCELQALAYRFGMTVPKYPYRFPVRREDASHPDLFLDYNRCILCERCVRASRDLDGKHVFEAVGRGPHRRIQIDGRAGLAGTKADVADRMAALCPVGAILRKRVGFAVPVGRRLYDNQPIGSDVESRGASL